MKEILIVDDEKSFRGHLRRELQARGFQTHEAASVREAIAMLAGFPQIKVILLDLEFKPKSSTDRRKASSDGTQVLEHIKREAGRYRVIVYTGHEEILDYAKAKAYGIFSYLPKGNADLVEAISFEAEKAFWDLERSSFEKHFEIQKKITSDASLNEVLNLVCESALEGVGGYTCHIRLLDLQMGDFLLTAWQGPFANVREVFRGRTTTNDEFSGRVARSGMPENIGDLQTDVDFLRMKQERLEAGDVTPSVMEYLNNVRSAYIVPISTKIFENQADAVLNISSTIEDFFTPQRCQVVDEFKTQAEIAITKVWLHHRREGAQEDYADCNELLIRISEVVRKQIREQLQRKPAERPQEVNYLEEIYEIVVRGISKIINAEMISIFRRNPITERLENVYELRGDSEADSDETFLPGESLTGKVYEAGKSIRIPSQENQHKPTEDLHYDDSHEHINLKKIPSHAIDHYLAVPLKIGVEKIGVIRAVNKKSGYYQDYFRGNTNVACLLERGFSRDCEATLETIASHLGVAIQDSELVTRLSRKVNQLETLTAVARRISSDSEADIDKLLSLIVNKTAEMMHAEICMLFLRDERDTVVNLRECYGMPMIPGAFYALGEGKTGVVAKTGEPIIEPVADQKHPGKYSDKVIPFLKPDDEGIRRIRSFMAVPIISLERSADRLEALQNSRTTQKARGKNNDQIVEHEHVIDEPLTERENIIGVLKVYNKTEDNFQFNQDDLSIFVTFASQIGVVLALAERSNSLSHLVRGVCHEIRNKAGMIPPNVSMIREDLAGETNVTKREAITGKLDLIETAASQALEFARDLLGFSDSHFKLREDLDINQLIQEAVEQLASTSATIQNARSVNLITNYIHRPLLCSVYRTPFIHIIQNIVMNAYEAMDEVEHGTLTIATATDSSGRIAYITLADTGKGISAEDIPKVFDATFFRRKGGNGLGLWIVRNYLSRMDGIISVNSQVNRGTVVNIQLPTYEAKSERSPWNKCVLVIEDDPLPAETVRNILTGIGYEYIIVDEGDQALSHIKHDSYDLIILDIGLGVVNGLELLRTAKEFGRDLPPVIVITGHEGHEHEAKTLGVFEFLRKDPLSLEKLRDAVLRATNSPN